MNLNDAVDVLQRRKEALIDQEDYIISDELGAGAMLEEDNIKKLGIGFDLDFEEVKTIAGEMAFSAVRTLKRATENGYPPSQGLTETMASAWFDGLLTGLVLAELRSRGAVA